MSLYGDYDRNHPFFARKQAINGGKKRIRTARRDRWGRLLPNDETKTLPEPVNHGSAGGQALLRKYGKDHFKKLSAKKKEAALLRAARALENS